MRDTRCPNVRHEVSERWTRRSTGCAPACPTLQHPVSNIAARRVGYSKTPCPQDGTGPPSSAAPACVGASGRGGAGAFELLAVTALGRSKAGRRRGPRWAAAQADGDVVLQTARRRCGAAVDEDREH